MSTEKPHRPDDTNDESSDRSKTDNERAVADILQAHFQSPAADDAFVDRLSSELQQAFAVESDNRLRIQPVSPVATSDAPTASAGVNARRLSARWIGGLVAATIILGVFGVWSRESVASWSEMMETLRNQPWVQTDAGRSSGWFSATRRVVARRGIRRTIYQSRADGLLQTYAQGDGRVVTGQAPSVASRGDQYRRSFEEDLIDWLATSAGDDSNQQDIEQEWRIVSESACYISDSVGRWIELTVVFESLASPPNTFTAVFLINPQTKLPVECLVRSDASSHSAEQKLSFDYPSEGPIDIFDMGVSRDMPLVSRDQDRQLRRAMSETDREAEKEADKVQPIVVAEVPRPKETVLSVPKMQEPPHLNRNDEPQPDGASTTASNSAASSKSVAPSIAPKAPAIPIPENSVAMTAQVDQFVSQLWTRKQVAPASVATDEEFLRRVYLDVIGRVPTISEYDSFFELDPDSRRGELVNELLDSREHALHMGSIWKRVLVPDDETAISRLGGAGKLEQWLSDSFSDNKPYDELVRELLLAEGRVNESGPLLFYAAAKLNAEELAARTSRTFLGMRMDCAECHDHPFDEWSQTDFWGLAAHFARISRPRGKIEMVSPVLRVHDADFGEVTLPETDTVVEPKLPITDSMSVFQPVENLKDAEIVGNSRRKELADWITDPNNKHFAQATVNRIWGHLFGKGLVDPIDDMGSHNQPTDPKLLEQLGRYFVQSQFDLRELMRVLISSEAYQLSSRNEAEPTDSENSADPNVMARMHLKPLTAEQLYDCLATATGRSDLGSVHAMSPSPATLAVNRFSDPGRAAFLAQFRSSIDQRTDYQAGIPQALTLMNGPMIFSATSDAPKGILRSLSAPFFDDATRVEKLFIATLSRKPKDEERRRYAELLKKQPADTPKHETLGDILWVLLNSAEFTMNH